LEEFCAIKKEFLFSDILLLQHRALAIFHTLYIKL